MARMLTTLDDAWSAWVAGRPEEAMQRCVGILEADGSQDTARALLAQLLVAHGVNGAAELAGELARVFIDRGDLPWATVLAKASGRGSQEVAAAFGKGSPRLADIAPTPPPLPPGSVPPAGERGEALVRRALAVLAAGPSPVGDTKVPHLALFSDLAPAALEQLLDAFEVREVSTGEVVVEEGLDGFEAFVVVRGQLRAVRGDPEQLLAELGPGAIFGEMALVSGAPRAASVIAVEPVQLLVATVGALEKVARKSPAIGEQLSQFCRSRMISNLVRHSRILGSVAPAEREALIERFQTRSFERGQNLVGRDDETEGLFLIASGMVQVMGRDSDGDELVVAELGPGDVVGEISLVLRRPATADVVATHHTVALELTRDEFQAAIRDYPQLLGELYDLATKRDDEMKTVVAQETLDVEDVVLL